MNHPLNINAWQIPDHFTEVVDAKKLKEILLATDGWIIARGYIYNIAVKFLGADVYSISLRKETFNC